MVAPEYTIHSDPGDQWEGKTLVRKEYRERVEFTRRAFPDIAFAVEETVATGERVAVRWSAAGTQIGDLPGLAANRQAPALRRPDDLRAEAGPGRRALAGRGPPGVIQQIG